MGVPLAEICDRIHHWSTAHEVERPHAQADICNRGDGSRGAGGRGGAAAESHAVVDHRSAVHNALAGCAASGDGDSLRRIERAAACTRLVSRTVFYRGNSSKTQQTAIVSPDPNQELTVWRLVKTNEGDPHMVVGLVPRLTTVGVLIASSFHTRNRRLAKSRLPLS